MALFVDIIDIRAKAGDGGNGCVSFHREKFVQQGGPDGGDGGKGGDIAFVASERMRTLMDFRFKRNFSAGNGADGSAGRCRGKAGEDIDIEVPVGTVVREKASGRVLLDMREAGVRRVLMRGGNGGFGNARFATPTRQAPQFAKPGEKRPMMELTLELKSIADVGLVGFPNVGKSTILSVVTSARPKIANYHFTTLQPNLGIVVQDEFSFVMADIPGLVEGASQGVGLGHAFLRHIERTRLLVHVIDISGSEMRDPLEDYDAILAELKAYGDLAARPMLIAANKCDLPGSEENLARLRAKLPAAEIFPVSAATHAGFAPLLRRAADLLRAMPAAEPFLEEEPMEIAEEEPFSIEMDGDVFVLSGPAIDRLFNSVNFEDELSLNYFHRTLRRWGVIDALRARGAKEGDSVRIEDMEFDFVE